MIIIPVEAAYSTGLADSLQYAEDFDLEKAKATLFAHQKAVQDLISTYMSPEPGKHCLVGFISKSDVKAIVPKSVIEAVERGERTLTWQEAIAEFPHVAAYEATLPTGGHRQNRNNATQDDTMR